MAFQKNEHIIPELKTDVQSQTEAISAETATKVPNNSVLSCMKFLIFGGKTWNMF
jgi:hypothetical protein